MWFLFLDFTRHKPMLSKSQLNTKEASGYLEWCRIGKVGTVVGFKAHRVSCSSKLAVCISFFKRLLSKKTDVIWLTCNVVNDKLLVGAAKHF